MIGNIGYERRLQALERRAREIGYGVPTPATAWTPQLWQNGTQLALTLDSAAYVISGPLVFVHARFTVNAVGAVGLMEIRNLPFACLYSCIGGETVVFTGGVNRVGATRMTAGSTTTVMTIDNQASDFGVAPAIALAVGDGVRMSALYLR